MEETHQSKAFGYSKITDPERLGNQSQTFTSEIESTYSA
jgi:hypothetical protein